ncbi:MAG: C40 family peptidase [Clostridia bacterium]|nr:C40 family peptidase [Clostridia bacterium]
MKKHLFLLILLLLPLLMLTGCEDSLPEMVAIVFSTATPVPTAVPSKAPATPVPTAEPTPEPTATPEPTPEPTPEIVLTEFVDIGRAREALLLDYDDVKIVTAARNRVTLYPEPSLDSTPEQLRNKKTKSCADILILDTVRGEDGTDFYYVQTAFSSQRGYVPVDKTVDSKFAEEGISGFALMKRPGCPVFYNYNVEDKVNAQESYHAVRILGSYRGFYYVVTEEGHFGYMEPVVLEQVTKDTIEEYLSLSTAENVLDSFSPEAFAETLESMIGSDVGPMEELLYEQLTQFGFFFSPGYYHFYTKPLSDRTLYPQGFYLDEVYNSRVYKLWNTSGRLVRYAGKETQWDYIDSYAALERGDLIFFTEYGAGDTAIVPGTEVVFRGKYSGYVTDCGVYLGNDTVLLSENGVLTEKSNFSSLGKALYFDCGRRINTRVTDVRDHFSETIISTIYDRLGTPYDNFTRVGDASYDCSGIICWALRSMGVHRMKTKTTALMLETTASGFANTKLFYLADGTKLDYDYINPYPKTLEDLNSLERGDLVYLYSMETHRVGHVMVYLGNNFVIHSTTIDEKYRGTLVAGIRPELQALYYGATRVMGVG